MVYLYVVHHNLHQLTHRGHWHALKRKSLIASRVSGEAEQSSAVSQAECFVKLACGGSGAGTRIILSSHVVKVVVLVTRICMWV